MMKVYIGIDWSEEQHAICFLREDGELLRHMVIAHRAQGFVEFDRARQALGLAAEESVVGLETAHNLLVDYLWEQGYVQVYVLPPNVVKSGQGTYRQSGAKDDQADAWLIADLLRRSQARYTPWQPDSSLTRQIRSAVRYIQQTNKDIVRNSNRLRSVLLRYYPAAVEIFSSLDTLICLAFVQTYPAPVEASQLSYAQFKVFLHDHHHSQPKKWPACYNRLQAAYPQASATTVAAYLQQAQTLAKILEVQVRSKLEWQKRLTQLYEQHPDREIYAHLPAAGAFLEPALLAKLGDDRNRFPTPKVLQATAGTCPVTEKSGKTKWVHFRYACDREFREIVQQWAKLSIEQSPWAEAYYHTIRPHCRSESEAIRRIANRWLAVLWRLWQERKPYDEEYHLKQHALRMKIL
jgi:transposase